MSRILDLLGTSLTSFQLGIAGLRLKNITAKIRARNAADNADAPLVGSVIAASGDFIEINEDAAGAVADWKYTVSRPAAGMTAALTLVLPPNAGTPGFALTTDGAGNAAWSAVASGTDKQITDTTSIAFGSAASVAMFNLPIGGVIDTVKVVVDTAFNGAPTLSVGITGTLSKYLSATSVDLTAAATTVFEVTPGVPAPAAIEALLASFAAGGATAGAARVLVAYSIPS